MGVDGVSFFIALEKRCEAGEDVKAEVEALIAGKKRAQKLSCSVCSMAKKCRAQFSVFCFSILIILDAVMPRESYEYYLFPQGITLINKITPSSLKKKKNPPVPQKKKKKKKKKKK